MSGQKSAVSGPKAVRQHVRHPLLWLFSWAGWTWVEGMDWLQENRWIADECIEVYDIAVVDVRRVLEAARGRWPLVARVLESRTALGVWCGRPDPVAPVRVNDPRWPQVARELERRARGQVATEGTEDTENAEGQPVAVTQTAEGEYRW